LFPFWGITAKESAPFVRAAALQYQYSKEHFALVEKIEDADFVVMPYPYERMKLACPDKVLMVTEEARLAGKLLIIDGAADLEYPINVPNSVVLRISQYQYSRQENEITAPFFAEDLLESYAGRELHVRKKTPTPSVAFTGWAAMSFKKQVTTFFKELPITLTALIDAKRGAEHKGVLFRNRALTVLKNTTGIETHFIARATYSGHTKTVTGSIESVRQEFVDNLLGSDYALCVRGDANGSVRLYEVLSLGRIPLFLDTACVLPLEDRINYRDFCVFVDWRDTDRIGEILVDFHEKLTPERFEEMQREARRAYREYLRYDSFSKQLSSKLREYLDHYKPNAVLVKK
jgi:hypothetical protein